MIFMVVDALEEVPALLGEYEQFLSGKASGTMDAYLRTARQLIEWLARQPGSDGQFQPQQLTKTAVEQYLAHLEREGLSLHHRARVRSTISNFARFLIEEKRLLQRNPTRGIELPRVPLGAPHPLSKEQRSILLALVEQDGDLRGAALFALGYWAGCRVSELSWLQMVDTHLDPGEGWLCVRSNECKCRNIHLLNKARQPLYAYIQATRGMERAYVFRSQRSERLTEEAIHYWFRTLKEQAPQDQRAAIHDLTFNDLRYDFAHRARTAGWPLEKVGCYLGLATRQGALPSNG